MFDGFDGYGAGLANLTQNRTNIDVEPGKMRKPQRDAGNFELLRLAHQNLADIIPCSSFGVDGRVAQLVRAQL